MRPQLNLTLFFASLLFLFSCLSPDPQSEMRLEMGEMPSSMAAPAVVKASAPLPEQGEIHNISGPYTKKNLQIFLLHGQQSAEAVHFLTLEEALKKNYVQVNESGNVQQLTVDNLSDEYIFLQSGDIVKGGRQDRTIQQDLVLRPKAKQIPLASFCVERSRWSARGKEDAGKFGTSENMLSSRELKYAGNYEKSQSKVWSKVSAQQTKLNEKLSNLKGYDVAVQDSISGTSLELTLDNKDLISEKDEMKAFFEPLINAHEDVVGFAYAVNGELYGADVYGHSELFKKLWPKLLESVIVESVGELDKTKEYAALDAQDVFDLLQKGAAAKGESVANANGTRVTTAIDKKGLTGTYQTFADTAGKHFVHQNFLKLDSSMVADEVENSIQSR